MNEEIENIEILYKYRVIDSKGHTERIFTHNELYFSRPLDFNDPFDCLPKFIFTASKIAVKQFLEEQLSILEPNLINRRQRKARLKELMKKKRWKNPKIMHNLEKHFNFKIKNETGICSFSQIPDHVLMWSHYADSHRGICLQFEQKSDTPYLGTAKKVHYQKEYPIINPIVDSMEQKVVSIFLTKAKFWEYEREWRIILAQSGPGAYPFPPEHLKGVILGVYISDDNKDQVISWIRERDCPIEVYQARLKEKEYGIYIDSL